MMILRSKGILLIALLAVSAAAQRGKTIAITIDDLPVVTSQSNDDVDRKITTDLLATLKRWRVSATGFVNESQLFPDGERDLQKIDLLKKWLTAGMSLGNHTYSHASLNGVGLEAYEADILTGEAVTKKLLADSGRRIRYFRHPYLEAGETPEIKQSLDRFLAKHGYRVAPVTVEASDYIFADAYEKAVLAKDAQLTKRVVKEYSQFFRKKLDFWEKQTRTVFGRNIAQVLLIHASLLNADHLNDIFTILRRRGYRFVSLDRALRDSAYRSPDRYFQKDGVSWLTRWAETKGEGFVLDEPDVPKWITTLAGEDDTQ